MALAITYWFNMCLAHNLYITFYSYKNTYPTRIKFYQIGSLFVIIFTFLSSLLFHKENRPENLFVHDYYGDFYLGVFYLVGLIMNLYIFLKIYQIVYRKEADFIFSGMLFI